MSAEDNHQKEDTNDNNINYYSDEETKRRKFVCNFVGCDQRFVNNDHLLVHTRRKHTFEKPFECAECQKTFVRKYDLDRHQKNIHSVGTYECDECHKLFSSEVYVLKHKKIHSSIRKHYSCHLCDYKSKKLENLKRHIGKEHTLYLDVD